MLIFLSHIHTAPDTRSNAPARRDEDRVIRPLVRGMRTSPGQYHLSVLLFSCQRDSLYLSGQSP